MRTNSHQHHYFGMSLAIGHFAFGAGTTIGFLLLTETYTDTHRDFAIAIGGGLFAMIPDISKLVPALASLHNSILANIFFLHGFLDSTDPTDSVAFSAIWISYMAFFGLILIQIDDKERLVVE